jgi:hypothetical protein
VSIDRHREEETMRVFRVAAIVLVALIAGSAAGAAQEATPQTGFDPLAIFPAHIHAGTCADPGEIAFPLADGGFGLPAPVANGTPSAVSARYVGPDDANAAIVSVTTVDAPLDGLVSDGYVIDADTAGTGSETETRIVCGAIGGFLAGDDLVFGLQEANASRYHGAAWLHANGDDTTTVTLFLVSELGSAAGGQMGAATAVPETVAEAEPLAPLPSTVEVTGVVIVDGTFAADELNLVEDVPTVLHVVNGDDRDYRFRIDDLVATTPLPANQLTVIELTTPSAGTFTGQLLVADDDTEVDSLPVTVAPPGDA